MGHQGQPLSEKEQKRIVHILRMTELQMTQIADRFHVSKGAIHGINKKFKVRAYGGNRNRWTIDSHDNL